MERPRLVRFPPDLQRVELDDLESLGLSQARAPLVALLADLPLVPTGEDNAVLVGPERVALPCLAILGRRVGQGLRDYNVSLMHDRARLASGRLKMAFLRVSELLEVLPEHRAPLVEEAALFVVGLTPPLTDTVTDVLAARARANLATFATADEPAAAPTGWRRVLLGG